MAGIEKSMNIDSYKKQLLVDLLRETMTQDIFSKQLEERLRQLIGKWEYNNYINRNNLKNSNDEFNPLDLEFQNVVLTPKEKKTIQYELEKMIINKYPNLLEEFYKITEGDVKKGLKDADSKASELTKEQRKVIDMCNRYYEDLKTLKNVNLEMCHLMKEWIDLRLGVTAKKQINKAEMCNLKSKLTELEANMINIQLKRFVYCKASTVKDYMDYYNSLKESLDEYKKEIMECKRFLKGEIDELNM